MSATSSQAAGATLRARPQARKRVTNDDAPYFGPPGINNGGGAAGGGGNLKRPAPDTDMARVKRKRADPLPSAFDVDHRISLVEFDKLSLPTLYRYLTIFDLIPTVHPSPLNPDDPPLPASLMQTTRSQSKATVTSSLSRRLLNDDDAPTRMPIKADVEELQTVLASIAERHFREVLAVSPREEVDTLASFMCAVEKCKGAGAGAGAGVRGRW